MLGPAWLPFLYGLRHRAYRFADYLDKWIVLIEDGEL